MNPRERLEAFDECVARLRPFIADEVNSASRSWIDPPKGVALVFMFAQDARQYINECLALSAPGQDCGVDGLGDDTLRLVDKELEGVTG
jgi:hypothetical protein